MINRTKNDFCPENQNCRQMTLGNRYASKANGTRYYPMDDSGSEYMEQNLPLIENDGNFIYPMTPKGKPRYRLENGREVYEIVNGKQIIGTGVDGNQYYAKDKFGNEYYPDDNTPAKLSDGTPKYALTKGGEHIFPIDKFGNEYYLSFVDLNKPTTIPNRYAVSVHNDEIYPLMQTLENNETQYLINNTYANDRYKKPYYPKDGFKNEYYRTLTDIDLREYRQNYSINRILLNRYALTSDGKIILPTVNDMYYRSPSLEPRISAKNVLGKLIRDNDKVSDYVTNVSPPNFISPEYFKPYKYKHLITNETKLVVPKQSPQATINFVLNNTSVPFYRRWCFWAFLLIVVIVKSFIIWWSWFKINLYNNNISPTNPAPM